jgi:hypothetical protein
MSSDYQSSTLDSTVEQPLQPLQPQLLRVLLQELHLDRHRGVQPTALQQQVLQALQLLLDGLWQDQSAALLLVLMVVLVAQLLFYAGVAAAEALACSEAPAADACAGIGVSGDGADTPAAAGAQHRLADVEGAPPRSGAAGIAAILGWPRSSAAVQPCLTVAPQCI